MVARKWGGGMFWRESNRVFHLNQRRILSFFDDCPENPVFMDLGCGDLRFTSDVAEKLGAVKVRVVDLSEPEEYEGCTLEYELVKHDLNTELPLEDNSVDVISAYQIIEHLWNTPNFFRETCRVLKPGGVMVLSTPNLSSLHSIPFILLGQQPPIIHFTDVQVGNFLKGVEVLEPGHQKAFNLPSIHDLSERYGFKVDQLDGYGFYFLPNPLQEVFSKLFGRYGTYVNARLRKPAK
ncbi:MAG: methyltransferase domain-containing protein [Candidatus Altiarchaeales archaeon]|nr:methyltransferase domain-containing protein [Candidatus Altiarchaeales archaeon]MBD3416321.1 methyltransferase domain-containing protein [Candidatus Altiarchaeales archaeon]